MSIANLTSAQKKEWLNINVNEIKSEEGSVKAFSDGPLATVVNGQNGWANSMINATVTYMKIGTVVHGTCSFVATTANDATSAEASVVLSIPEEFRPTVNFSQGSAGGTCSASETEAFGSGSAGPIYVGTVQGSNGQNNFMIMNIVLSQNKQFFVQFDFGYSLN